MAVTTVKRVDPQSLNLKENVVAINRVTSLCTIDRHQRGRKVESPAYREEARSYDREHDIDDRTVARITAKTAKIALRMLGVVPLVRLPSIIQPALNLEFPARSVLMASQMMRRRAQLPFAE